MVIHIYFKETIILSVTVKKFNSKLNKIFEMRSETMQLLEENLESTLEILGTCNNVLSNTPKTEELMSHINKYDGINVKMSEQQKKKFTMWRTNRMRENHC